MTFAIRPAAPEDFDAWLAVHEAVAGEGRWIGAELPFDLESVRRHFDEHVADDDKQLWVAVSDADDGRIVGNLAISLHRYGVADFGMSVRRLEDIGPRNADLCPPDRGRVNDAPASAV